MDFLGGEGIFVGKMCIFSPKNLKVMKRVAIYGREASEEVGLRMPFVTSALAKDGVEVFMYKPFYDRLPVVGKDVAEDVKGCFATKQELVEAGVDMLFSVGGDGALGDPLGYRATLPDGIISSLDGRWTWTGSGTRSWGTR